jgi:hypothetical protein
MGRKHKAAKSGKSPPASKGTAWRPANPLLFSCLVTGIYFLVALAGMLHHTMWRDEHQAWLIARDAHSLAQLFHNLRYEGNPALWHLLLFAVTRFTTNPAYMQALHLLIACGFVFIFNRYCPIAAIYKILFTFGYFSLYEYAIISRSYGLGVLLTFIACALYKHRTAHYLLLWLSLGLLANVTVYGVIISLGLGGVLLLDYFLPAREPQTTGPNSSGTGNSKVAIQFWAGLTIYVLLATGALWQILPSKDNTFPAPMAETWLDYPRWLHVLSRLFTTYFYVPNPAEIHFWNTNAFFDDGAFKESGEWPWLPAHPTYLWCWAVAPGLLFVLGMVMFLDQPLVLLLYAGSTLALLAVYYYTGLFHERYCGHLLIVLLVCCWLAEYYPKPGNQRRRFRRLSNLLVLMNDPLQAAFDGKHFTPVERCLLANDIKLDLLRFIRAGIVPEEEYHIYLIQKTDPSKVDPRQYPLLSL